MSGPGVRQHHAARLMAGPRGDGPARGPAARGRAAARPSGSWSTTPARTWPRSCTPGICGRRSSATRIVRVLEHLGHTVIRAAHLGDWGTQFGMLIEHALDIGEQATAEQLATGRVHRLLPGRPVEVRLRAPPSPTAPGGASCSSRRGTSSPVRLWQTLVSDSLEYLHEVYARLGITLTDADMDPESFYNPMLASVLRRAAGQGHRGHQRRRPVRLPAGVHRPRRAGRCR